MISIFSADHSLRNAQTELYGGQLVRPHECPERVEMVLERAATNQEREMDGLLSTMTNLLGPFMVVFMGAIVMFIVIALLLPIFQLNDLVK